jgi:hypothetical protein
MCSRRCIWRWLAPFDPNARPRILARERKVARAADRADAWQGGEAALDFVVGRHALRVLAVPGGWQRDEGGQQAVLPETRVGTKDRLEAAQRQAGAHEQQ